MTDPLWLSTVLSLVHFFFLSQTCLLVWRAFHQITWLATQQCTVSSWKEKNPMHAVVPAIVILVVVGIR